MWFLWFGMKKAKLQSNCDSSLNERPGFCKIPPELSPLQQQRYEWVLCLEKSYGKDCYFLMERKPHVECEFWLQRRQRKAPSIRRNNRRSATNVFYEPRLRIRRALSTLTMHVRTEHQVLHKCLHLFPWSCYAPKYHLLFFLFYKFSFSFFSFSLVFFFLLVFT